jgi:hypothetical protein
VSAGILRKAQLVFCYGEEMGEPGMSRLCHGAKYVGIAKASGFALGFYGHSARWDGAWATIEPMEDGEVWGALYELSPSDSDRLDGFYDARFNGTGLYFHYPILALAANGLRIEALGLRKDILGDPAKPSDAFLACLLDAARERRFPERYVDGLALTPTTPAGYEVPLRSSLVAGSAQSLDSCVSCKGD